MVTKEPLRVEKLLPRHTKAGIKVEYDDHCVKLTHNGADISYEKDGIKVVAVWTGLVSFDEMATTADEYLNWRAGNDR